MSTLALLGGEPIVKKRLGSTWPVFGAAEEKLLMEAFRSGKWCRLVYKEKDVQSMVTRFEDAFAAYCGTAYAVAVTNGTQALECALKAAGVKPGEEVIVPALTFVATATAVLLVGAKPVIVDVDPATYNMNPAAAEAAITPRTKAIIPVHNGGYPADMDRINAIAAKYGLRVIEDCAHAHGSEWKGKRAGSLGHFGCFSFQQGKTMTAGEGGIVLTNDKELADLAYSFHNIGRVAGRPFTDFYNVASNLRMTEFQGAVLLGQLSRLDEQIEIRERNIAYLAEGMQTIAGVKPLRRTPEVTRWSFYYWNFHYRAAELDNLPRHVFIEAMEAEGVPVMRGAHGNPIYHHPVLKTNSDVIVADCPEAERIAATEALALGHAVLLAEKEDMDLILAAMEKISHHAGELLKRVG
ncbi:MAG TPA: DegT/DnrJ/EryC1/StrS family aminotransferase [Firmicutes bacterium]|nr:DegT/DnrJ/EryC1/StrS family aminotransferase [Bacillota bacterium]